jgi:hypothetical protein
MRFIYGLIDPRDHVIRYVGQCVNMRARYSLHLCQARNGKRPVHAWIREIAPAVPVMVLLETVSNRRVSSGHNLRRKVDLASVMEAKWLKRFRRTVLNVNRKQCSAYDLFINSTELQTRFGLE